MRDPMTDLTEFVMFGHSRAPRVDPERIALLRLETPEGLFSLGDTLHTLLLRCARTGLDAGPILTPEQHALDALLKALMGECT